MQRQPDDGRHLVVPDGLLGLDEVDQHPLLPRHLLLLLTGLHVREVGPLRLGAVDGVVVVLLAVVGTASSLTDRDTSW